MGPFRKTNADGKPKTCKFCHAEVWWNIIEARWYDVGGETLHVENCERRQQYFRDQAFDASESKRQLRK